MAIHGTPVPFGVTEPKPLKGFPEGKARIRIRHDEFVKIRILNKKGIREFHPKDQDGFWVPLCECGSNQDA